jgi:hypothetical protein
MTLESDPLLTIKLLVWAWVMAMLLLWLISE